MLSAEALVAEWNPPSKTDFRKAGWEAFREAGFPTPRNEDWKFTSLAGLKGLEPTPPGSAPTPNTVGSTLSFVDGKWKLSVVHGADISLVDSGAAHTQDALDALNTAFVGQTLRIEVPAGSAATLCLAFSQSGSHQHPRVQLHVGRGARLNVLEHSIGSGAYLLNPLWEIQLSENAEVRHTRALNDAPAAYHLASFHVELGRDARFYATSLALGGTCTRSSFHARLAQGATFDLSGLALARQQQLHDHHLVIDHAEPHSESRQRLKGVIDEEGRGVFTGKVIVRPGAVKANSDQSIRNLLLSESAIANARPQLEIDNDDVKCVHGTTVGRLDEEALFYLRARGIPLLDARRLLTEAFAGEILESIACEEHRSYAEIHVTRWLAEMGS